MNALLLFTVFLPIIVARPQQAQIEPAYLRDYYAQLSQQQGAPIRGSVQDVTPIFEQSTSFQPSQQLNHATVGQQIRVRDPVQDQVRHFFPLKWENFQIRREKLIKNILKENPFVRKSKKN